MRSPVRVGTGGIGLGGLPGVGPHAHVPPELWNDHTAVAPSRVLAGAGMGGYDG